VTPKSEQKGAERDIRRLRGDNGSSRRDCNLSYIARLSDHLSRKEAGASRPDRPSGRMREPSHIRAAKIAQHRGDRDNHRGQGPEEHGRDQLWKE
jgi:hypothetical protein